MRKTVINQTRLFVFLISVLLIATAHAQETEHLLEEIVVTATKRGDQNIQSIAGGINLLSGNDLDKKGVIDFEGFSGAMPALHFQDLGPGDKEYIIRGINGSGPAVVGAYFDEYVITATDKRDGGGKTAPLEMIDLERVEVLNGPQGTLYGANSMAGNIKFISRKPDIKALDFGISSDISATKEGGINFTLSGIANIPLIRDVLGTRVVIWRTDAEGWIDQPRLRNGPGSFAGNAEDINSEITNGGRIMLRLTPNAGLR